ncbi:MAG: metallophosphoesterase family protein [Planctomycetota bacterium]|jgi:3',5'-cyclic AMP phosphodiesterase CpdA
MTGNQSLRILHVSDLHFGRPYLPTVGERLLRMAEHLMPDAIVVSGDFTQRAKPQQFADAAAFLKQLPPVPQLVIPGNHDVPLYRVAERMLKPHALYRQYISEELNPVLQLDGAVLVGLDTTSPYRNLTNGRIHQWQLDQCSEVLRDVSPEAARIVVAHHHFAPAPDYLHDWTMPKARRAIDRFIDLGVEMILGGHLHRAYIGNSLDFFPGSHRERGIIIVQCGTTTSRRGRGREREKNSFNMIEVTQTSHRVTHYVYFDEERGFTPFSQHIFPRPGQQFEHDVLQAEHEAETAQENSDASVTTPV